MLLTITTTHRPAADIGFLLAKHPDKCQSFTLSYGDAHVFYPEVSDQRCTVCLLLDLDPVGLVRGRRGSSGEGASIFQYVNDRPYVSSSFLSVAIAKVFSAALKGQSKEREQLARQPIPLVAGLSAVPCRGGDSFLRSLFEPLGYEVKAERIALDPMYPEWGEGAYYRVELSATCVLSQLLTHLYVLLPVLDNSKHYWVGKEEIDNLLAKGEGWLASHPEREQITSRYLKHQRPLVREALQRLIDDDDPEPEESEDRQERAESVLEERVSLNEQRIGAVLAVLKEVGARRVLDLGCGEARLIHALLRHKEFDRVVGVDVSYRALEIAADRLRLSTMPARQRERVELFHGALTYRDRRFEGFEAACAIEVVEHVDPGRLTAFERVVFEFACPLTIVLTTPNAEYNVLFENLPENGLRHRDHRFEWTREEFEAWASGVARRHGYSVRFAPVGPVDPAHGAPTQMGVFSR